MNNINNGKANHLNLVTMNRFNIHSVSKCTICLTNVKSITTICKAGSMNSIRGYTSVLFKQCNYFLVKREYDKCNKPFRVNQCFHPDKTNQRLQHSNSENKNNGIYTDSAEESSKTFKLLSDYTGQLSMPTFLSVLRKTGLRENDPRLQDAIHSLMKGLHLIGNHGTQSEFIDKETFLLSGEAQDADIIAKALRHQLVIPEFQPFCTRVDEMFWRAKTLTSGALATYIPQLARYNPEGWGMALCTVDGQRYALGDAYEPVCLQAVSQPLTYAMVLDELGPGLVHRYVGQEPSGQPFDSISLDPKGRPHNPMVNAGAIVTGSLYRKGLNAADRFDSFKQKIKQLSGGDFVSFNNPVFLSERETADRNFSIGYHLKEQNCFPNDTNVREALDFYFQTCSIEVTCDSAAVIAATLANGGNCPLTGSQVLDTNCIRDMLSLMRSCGMYEYSGQFAFKVGLPGKSGVSGGVMLVIPNVMGLFMWSPPLDKYGNSCRGMQFCEDFVSCFNFHNFDNLNFIEEQKTDPRVLKADVQAELVVNLLTSAYNGDVTALRRSALIGVDMGHADYDGRTALHVAAVEGHNSVVEFLLDNCGCSPLVTDRWGFSPLDDARRFGRDATAELMESFIDNVM